MPLQDWIHNIEEGKGRQVITVVAAVLLFAMAAVLYDFRVYKNFNTQEAMDTAQLARNIAEGQGYTTQFVRPLSIHLVRERRGDGNPMMQEGHPDLANPPVYPYVVAGLMRLLPFDFELPALGEKFRRYQPEVLIAVFNQVLFLAAVLVLFSLARRLFDLAVASLSALLFMGAELYWRFSVSGLSTMLLILLFLLLAWCLTVMDEREQLEEEEGKPGTRWVLGMSLVAGVMVGIMALTRYSFCWLALPLAGFLGAYMVRHRFSSIGVALLAFLLVVSPWLVRNYNLSGNFFGTAGYAISQATPRFPTNELERSFDARSELKEVTLNNYMRKLVVNGRAILQNDLPKLGGNWTGAFFLVGLLVPFKNRTLSHLRVFTVMALVVFSIVQAWGRTHLSAESPEITTENLLSVVAPLVIVFGVGLFLLLLPQAVQHLPELRYVVGLVFVAIMCAPLLIGVVSSQHPIAYPPYFPPLIQDMSRWMKERELVMSDVPWAVAWYGKRQCAWQTIDPGDTFFQMDDEIKPVKALYLSPAAVDSRFLSDMVKDRKGWGRFLLKACQGQVPAQFPLRVAAGHLFPEHIFLTDWERWKFQPGTEKE